MVLNQVNTCDALAEHDLHIRLVIPAGHQVQLEVIRVVCRRCGVVPRRIGEIVAPSWSVLHRIPSIEVTGWRSLPAAVMPGRDSCLPPPAQPQACAS